MNSSEAKAYVDQLYTDVHGHWDLKINHGPFMTQLRAGTLPLANLRRFFKDWGLFSIEVVALNAVSYYVHLPFFVSNYDLLGPLCDKVAEELISPKPPGHILILLETAKALGLSKEELFEQPASASGRAISDYCRRVFTDGSLIELWGAHVYEETLGHWSKQWAEALVTHYGLEQTPDRLFYCPCRSGLGSTRRSYGPWPAQSHDPAAHLGTRQDRQEARLRSEILRLHHGRSPIGDGKPRHGESIPNSISACARGISILNKLPNGSTRS